LFGLAENHWQIILSELKKFQDLGCQVFVFGSRARGDHKPFSDLDVLLKCKESHEVLLSEVREFFEESNIPIKIDIVRDQDLAQSYRTNVDKDLVQIL
jgi:uncharacterized protein